MESLLLRSTQVHLVGGSQTQFARWVWEPDWVHSAPSVTRYPLSTFPTYRPKEGYSCYVYYITVNTGASSWKFPVGIGHLGMGTRLGTMYSTFHRGETCVCSDILINKSMTLTIAPSLHKSGQRLPTPQYTVNTGVQPCKAAVVFHAPKRSLRMHTLIIANKHTHSSSSGPGRRKGPGAFLCALIYSVIVISCKHVSM